MLCEREGTVPSEFLPITLPNTMPSNLADLEVQADAEMDMNVLLMSLRDEDRKEFNLNFDVDLDEGDFSFGDEFFA